ncbi:phospholipase C, phosphocholine-specific [Acetobacter sp. AN02]|uniref:phosphocholine-specific phospholipase C n=1 Tax=Acetobacter sp. AN02 TaxID=2894186 RepID=UPI00243434A1|nr:phospholipase C, phosphocholine-specific [Acetobacter sp. AN02]MDG6094055.1 phospholipase C, phosphocholine-specific [Acetobacter sp. AN02]
MAEIGRRTLLRSGGGTLAATLAASISRALAIPARRRSGTLEDVEHIVVLMQENRSFDHYFGHLSGVRGVSDRHPVRGPDGIPVWSQERKNPAQNPAQGRVMPFRLNTHVSGAQCVLDLDHNWAPTHAAINAGWNNQWPRHKSDMTMGYYQREDIPYHYALADAFTVCDHYFCSTPTQTHPNRFFLMTGTVDANGTGGGPVLDNIDWVDRQFYPGKSPPPFTWTTYPERLEAAGISWQVYQQGLSVTDPENGNFGTNVLMNFRNYVDAPEGSALYRRAMTKRTLDDLLADVQTDRLPQISWLLPPAAWSEHPRWTPGYGATFIARVLNILTSSPEVWAKTVLLVMYDENDGYFDHVPPPQPPTPVLPGRSTVTTDGEIHTRATPYEPEKFKADQLPYGLGPRVPMLAISPWSTGGFVCSEVFDHTSVLRFMEARFGVAELNITPWRRSVCGDLTSAFDFSHHKILKTHLQDTSLFRSDADASCRLPSPAIPEHSHPEDIGQQEPGHRPTRPLAYRVSVSDTDGPDKTLNITFKNHADPGICFYVWRQDGTEPPRRFTLKGRTELSDTWTLPDDQSTARFMILGQNGFARYLNRTGPRRISASLIENHQTGSVTVQLHNLTDQTTHITLRDNAYGRTEQILTLRAHETSEKTISLDSSFHWYDISVLPDGEENAMTRFAGYVETGRPGRTDPALGAPVI